MATSTRSKLFIPDPPKSAPQLFQLAKKQLLGEGCLLLMDVPENLAMPLIEGLDSDPAVGEGKYRYNYEDRRLLAFRPSLIHNSIQIGIQDILNNMVDSKFLTWDQRKRLKIEVGTTFDQFVGQYAGTAVKEPDLEIKVEGRQQTAGTPHDCPIWINESGWTESNPQLDRDITKWLAGTGYGVLVAIETKYTQRQNSRVAGYVIFHTNNGTTINRKEIFPAPQDPANDLIPFTRQDLFGNTLPFELGQSPQDVYILNVSVIRHSADIDAREMGLTPV